MPSSTRKILSVLASLLIAAAITYLPWFVLFRLEGDISQLVGMTAILWAPLALLLGIVAGILFSVACWPRQG